MDREREIPEVVGLQQRVVFESAAVIEELAAAVVVEAVEAEAYVAVLVVEFVAAEDKAADMGKPVVLVKVHVLVGLRY